MYFKYSILTKQSNRDLSKFYYYFHICKKLKLMKYINSIAQIIYNNPVRQSVKQVNNSKSQ